MSAAATSYEESVGSCGPPTPKTSLPPPAPTPTPVRRQLKFTDGGDMEEGDDDDELLCRLADDIERGYGEAKLRAQPCVCGRGVCAVELDDQIGRWKYVCPSQPKCRHVTFCEELDPNPKSQPTSRNHHKPLNPCAFNTLNNHMASPRTPVNVHPQVAGTTTPIIVHPQVTGTTTPVIVRPQVAGDTTLFTESPQGAGAITLVNGSRHGERTLPLANASPQGVGTTTPAKFASQGAFATTPAKCSPQGDKSNEVPICQCKAGKCQKSRIGEEDWYVCHIPKGKGACDYRVLVCDFVKDIVPSAQAIPCVEVHQEFPSMLHQPIATVNTPSKSPMRPNSTPSPISPNSRDLRCNVSGHWVKDSSKQSPGSGACFNCGMQGHWKRNCPQL